MSHHKISPAENPEPESPEIKMQTFLDQKQSFLEFLEEISEKTTANKISEAEREQFEKLFLEQYTHEPEDVATHDLMGIAMNRFLQDMARHAKSPEQFEAAKLAVLKKFQEMMASLNETGKYPQEKVN